MQLFDSEKFWVDLISYASIVSAAIFGLIGLFTEYKKDGKITLWGRLAAGGIALSAVLAMISAVLQERIATEEGALARKAADAERRQQQAQFEAQLGQFTGLYRQMGEVNRNNRRLLGDMQRSLSTQDVLLTNARRSMLLTASLTAQERQNTGRVLRGLWDEANRIIGASIQLEIVYRCIFDDAARYPVLLPPGARAEIGLARMDAAEAQNVPFNRFDTRRVMDAEVSLESVYQLFTLQRSGSFGGQISRFSAFSNPGLQRFADPENWQDVAVEVIVTAEQPEASRELWNLTEGADLARGMRAAELREFYDFAPRMEVAGFDIVALPCIARMALVINERIVAASEAIVVHVRAGPNDDRGLFVVKFPVTPAIPDALPRYAGTGQQELPLR